MSTLVINRTSLSVKLESSHLLLHDKATDEKRRVHLVDDKRLRRVARVCEDYGLRIEKSVFECYLENELFLRLWEKLAKIVNEEEGDRIVAYPVAASEQKKIMTLGGCNAGERPKIFIF